MPSTYTVNLGIEKPATGEQSGTWGDTTNINFDILDQAINGCLSLTLASAGTSGSPNTLAISDGATSDGRNKWVEFVDGGDLGATAYVQLTPNDAEKIVFIRNSLSGSRSVILFQGTYDAGRDLEVPAGVDMVVKFSGGGATATTTDIFTKLRATEITTPTLTTDDLTAATADINDGTVEAVIGGTTPKAGTFTTLTANTNLTINATTTVDGVIDDDTMATASATKLSTSESIKAYVDSSVGAQDTLSEILANGNTSGGNNLIIDSGQALTANTINETTAGSGVTIDSVLMKDDGVNATNLEITNIKANDGTAAGSIANSTGAFTINSFVSNSVDIGGGAIDDTTVGATTPASGSFTTVDTTSTVTTNGDLNMRASSTENRYIELGQGRTGDGSSFIDLVGDATYTDYGARLIRNGGANAGASLRSRGTGALVVETIDAGPVILKTDGNSNFKVEPDGDIWFYNDTYTAARILYNRDTEFVINDDSADFDFRVESNNETHMLFVDGGNDLIGVGTSAPAARLHVREGAVLGSTLGDYKSLLRLQQETGNEQYLDMIAIRTSAGSDWTTQGIRLQSIVDSTEQAYIQWNGASTQAGIEIGTGSGSSGYLDSSIKPRLTIKSSSELVFNDNGENYDFRVESDTNTHALFVDASANLVNIGDSSSSWTAPNLVVSAPMLDLASSTARSTNAGIVLRPSLSVDSNGWYGMLFSNSTVDGFGYTLGGRRTQTDGSLAGFDIRYHNNSVSGTSRMYFASDQISVNEESGNYDFRVESDSVSDIFLVDAENNAVAIKQPQGGNLVNFVPDTGWDDVLTTDGVQCYTGTAFIGGPGSHAVCWFTATWAFGDGQVSIQADSGYNGQGISFQWISAGGTSGTLQVKSTANSSGNYENAKVRYYRNMI